jgi:hypothetical protein
MCELKPKFRLNIICKFTFRFIGYMLHLHYSKNVARQFWTKFGFTLFMFAKKLSIILEEERYGLIDSLQ